MKKLFNLIILFTIVISGCVPVSSLQTARTIPKGDMEVGGYLGLMHHKNEPITDSIIYFVPIVDGYFGYGISSKADLSIHLDYFGLFNTKLKYMLIGDHTTNFGLSSGFGISMFPLAFGQGLNFELPVYASYYFSPSKALYANPKYFYSIGHWTDAVDGKPTSDRFLISTGICLGVKHRFFLEYTYNFMYEDKSAPNQVSVGYKLLLERKRDKQ